MSPLHDAERLAAEWLRERETSSGSDRWYEVQLMARKQPEDAWRITLALLPHVRVGARQLTPEHMLNTSIGSIPNYILESHAEAFIDRVEIEAARNPAFRYLLEHMQLSDDVAPRFVLERLKAASGGRMLIYPAAGSDLARVAYDVAEEYRAGKLESVPLSVQFPVPLLAKEIERRFPRRMPEDYILAASKALEWSR
jgi:hypothetical protein